MNNPKVTLLTNVFLGTATRDDFINISNSVNQLYSFFEENNDLLRSWGHTVIYVKRNKDRPYDFFDIMTPDTSSASHPVSGMDAKYRIYTENNSMFVGEIKTYNGTIL